MLLAIDVGNTQTVIGVFQNHQLITHWRISTSVDRTSDENILLFRALFALHAPALPAVTGAVISSVVPGATWPIRHALKTHYAVDPLLIGSSIDAGMPILYENPREVGADRIVNAVAAYERWRRGLVVVDFGTATTFDCVSPQGEYLGGAIAPGIITSADALYHRAAKLPRIAIRKPTRAIGTNTSASMQAGFYYGYAGLVDGIVGQMVSELDFDVYVVATGGLATLIAEASMTIAESDEALTLRGLDILYHRQRGPGTEKSKRAAFVE